MTRAHRQRVRVRREDMVQRAVCQALDAVGARYFHPANEMSLLGVIRRTLVGIFARRMSPQDAVKAAREATARIGKAAGGIRQGQGVRAGVLDLYITSKPRWARGAIARGYALEVKDGGELTPEQREEIGRLREDDWEAGVGDGIDDCLGVLRVWGFIE